jgi:hypothetical protein
MNFEINKKIIKELIDYVQKNNEIDISKSEEMLLKTFDTPKLDIQELYEYQLSYSSFELNKLLFGTDKKKVKENEEKMKEFMNNFAKHLTNLFQEENHKIVKKVESVGRYINIYFKSSYIGEILLKIKDDSLFTEVEKKDEKVFFIL